MKEAFWGALVVTLSITSISFIIFFQNITNTEEHNYYLLKETIEAAMVDAVDLATYEQSTLIKIDRELFVSSFIKRFAQNADLSKEYVINFYDINEMPPKVSVEIKSRQFGNVTETFDSFDLVNKLDAILETPY